MILLQIGNILAIQNVTVAWPQVAKVVTEAKVETEVPLFPVLLILYYTEPVEEKGAMEDMAMEP